MTWEELEQQCLACSRCGLCSARHHVVFGTGNRDAEVLIVGEGPGEQEDLTGEPFVGRAGKLLDNMLELVDLSRKTNVYIANIVKCRPPENRDPRPDERQACIGWLSAQVGLLRPKILVCLGRIAASTMIREDFRITQEHGQWFDVAGMKAMAIYHPAALLRDPRKKPETFEDLVRLREQIRLICTHTYTD